MHRLELATGTAVWYRGDKPPAAIWWVLVRGPKQQRLALQALLSTDLTLPARHIAAYFVPRCSVEITFQEARLYLGLEGKRQWNDLATARSTPRRFALFSSVTLTVQREPDCRQIARRSARYKKARPTFVDALAQVRRALCRR